MKIKVKNNVLKVKIKAHLTLPKDIWRAMPDSDKIWHCYLHPNKNNENMLLSLYSVTEIEGSFLSTHDKEHLDIEFLSAFENP